ncbi:MAG: hypothetical protein LBG15_05290 [Dysgonamonadaceae bacterium]|jgi:hypothetical protein|nr:hypothetical protein [Dysgonamonadaceae bacterium]
MENKECRKERSPERAIINSDGHCRIVLGRKYCLLSRQGQHVGRKRDLFSPSPVPSGTECVEHQPNHILSLTGQGNAGEARIFYRHFVPDGTEENVFFRTQPEVSPE